MNGTTTAAPMRDDVEQARKFRKTALIEASQWFKDGDHPAVTMASDVTGATCENPLPFLDTLEGGNIVQPGDWIATGVKGEHWCIKPDVFAATYEPVNEVMPFGDAIDPNASHNRRHSARPDAGNGYATAFYEIATMLGIGARAKSPFEVWRDEMKPKLEARLTHPDAEDGNVQQVADALNAAQVLRCADIEFHRGYGAAIADFVAAMPQGLDREPQRQWPPALTTELRQILGMMCFQLGAPAHLFQKIGEFNGAEGITLRKRAEDEQAFMLHKLIGFWFEHGEDWGLHASADLTRAKAAAAALEPVR